MKKKPAKKKIHQSTADNSAPDAVVRNGKLYGRTKLIVAGVIGIHRNTLNAWENQGAPKATIKHEGEDYHVITDVIVWARDAKWSGGQSGDDPLLCGHNSPALEEYRRAKAKLAEMELEERRRATLSAADVEDGLRRILQMLEGVKEQKKLPPSPDFRSLVGECLINLKREIQHSFTSITID